MLRSVRCASALSPRALCLSAMHVPAAACTHISWQPGGVRGSPSMQHKAHLRAPREAIHAHRGRRSTRSMEGDPRASRELIQALQGTRSTRSKGGDPRPPRGCQTVLGGRPRGGGRPSGVRGAAPATVRVCLRRRTHVGSGMRVCFFLK